MGRKNIGVVELSEQIGSNRDTLARRLSGKSQMTLDVAFRIQRNAFPEADIKYLFAPDLQGRGSERGELMNFAHPNLTGEIAKKGIKKSAIAKMLGISDKTLWNKLYGKTPFTILEALTIKREFFPLISIEELFAIRESDGPLKK